MFKNVSIKEEDRKRILSKHDATKLPIYVIVNMALDALLGPSPFQSQPKKSLGAKVKKGI